MRIKSELSAVLFSVLVAACHARSGVSENFVSAERVINGHTISVLDATDRVLAESQFVPERRLQLHDGSVFIVGHPADKLIDAGSIRVKVKESGSDDTTVRVEMLSTLYHSPAEARAAVNKTLARIQSILLK